MISTQIRRLCWILIGALSLFVPPGISGEPASPEAKVRPNHHSDKELDKSPPSVIICAGETEVAQVWLSYDADNLYLQYRVKDTSPLKNVGDNWKYLFKTGDCVDLQLGLDAKAAPDRKQPAEGDIRVLTTVTKDGPIAVIYRYVVPGATEPVLFGSPTGKTKVDRVEKLEQAKIDATAETDGYVLKVKLPWTALSGKKTPVPAAGTKLQGDIGILLSDPDGAVTVERLYWSNKNTSIVADIPTEVRIQPDVWGTLVFEKSELGKN